jgi:oligopeptide transport system permease protein
MDKNMFVFQKSQNDELNRLVGKPTTNIKQILKRFFTNPISIIFFTIFIMILLIAIIIPLVSEFAPDKAINDKITVDIIRNAPPYSGANWSNIVISDSVFIEKLDNLKVNHKILSSYPDGTFRIQFSINEYLTNAKDIQGNALSGALKPVFGTDQNGIDIWTSTWTAMRNSLGMAICVSLVSMFFGTIIGSYIGFHAGRAQDTVLLRFVELISRIPSILLIVILLASLGSSWWSIFAIYFILSLSGPIFVSRNLIIRVKDQEFLLASRSIGASKFRIIFKHALPLIMGRMTPVFVGLINSVIAFESFLPLLGINNQVTNVTIGTIFDNARANIENLYALFLPTMLIILTSLSLRFISNGVTDALNNRLGSGR